MGEASWEVKTEASLHLPGWLGIQKGSQAPLLSTVLASPPWAAVRPSLLRLQKASQLETLLAGTGRPRLDWVWV